MKDWEEPGVLQSMGSQRVGQDLATEQKLETLPPFASGLGDRLNCLSGLTKCMILNKQQQQEFWRKPKTAEKKVSRSWCELTAQRLPLGRSVVEPVRGLESGSSDHFLLDCTKRNPVNEGALTILSENIRAIVQGKFK